MFTSQSQVNHCPDPEMSLETATRLAVEFMQNLRPAQRTPTGLVARPA
jgi:hypothetical protein